MGKKIVMVPAEEVDLSAIKNGPPAVQAPHLTGSMFKSFVRVVEAPVVGSLFVSHLKKQNKLVEMLRNTVIPEAHMFKPEFPPQGAVTLDEDGKLEDRVEAALKCLPHYGLTGRWNGNQDPPFQYWKIRDYAYAYWCGLVTPYIVAERIIPIIEEFNNKKPPAPF